MCVLGNCGPYLYASSTYKLDSGRRNCMWHLFPFMIFLCARTAFSTRHTSPKRHNEPNHSYTKARKNTFELRRSMSFGTKRIETSHPADRWSEIENIYWALKSYRGIVFGIIFIYIEIYSLIGYWFVAVSMGLCLLLSFNIRKQSTAWLK